VAAAFSRCGRHNRSSRKCACQSAPGTRPPPAQLREEKVRSTRRCSLVEIDVQVSIGRKPVKGLKPEQSSSRRRKAQKVLHLRTTTSTIELRHDWRRAHHIPLERVFGEKSNPWSRSRCCVVFRYTSLQAEDLLPHARREKIIREQMTPADLVGVSRSATRSR